VKATGSKSRIPLCSGIVIVGTLALALWSPELCAQKDQIKVTGKAASQVTASAPPANIRAWEAPGVVSAFGLIDPDAHSFLLSAQLANVSLGAGSISALPAANWSDGPGMTVFKGPFAIGTMLNNQNSSDDQCDIKSISTAFEAFINYDLPCGWYLNMVTTSPQVMCGAKHLIVPIGPSIGTVQSFSGTPVDLELGAQYESHMPNDGPGWQLRFMVRFPFPN